jgi:hypothetical protein
MARLDEQNRKLIWSDFMSELSQERDPVAVDKVELRSALDAMDDWLNANMATIINAIPAPTRNKLTNQQKLRLLVFIVQRRFLTGA